LDSFGKKYPNNKGKPLSVKQIQCYGKQILKALAYLHELKWYHMHLHTGNILIDNDGMSVRLTELENFANNIPVKNEMYLNYVYSNFNTNNSYNTTLTEVFKANTNVFEKIDIVCFGRVLYELTFGKELKAPYPDEMEYNNLDKDIADILQQIFPRVKKGTYIVTVPSVSASDLLSHKFFQEDNNNGEDGNENVHGKFKNYLLDDDFDRHSGNFEINVNDESFCSFIKETVFDQNKFLKTKLTSIKNKI
jgi:serine/threonine protein kinase